MKYVEDKEISGLIVISPEVFYDVRGEYVNTYNTRDYAFLGEQFVEDDFSISTKHVLRGLHGDSKTKKLIQCLYGDILLAVADLRKESPSYLQTRLYALKEKNRKQVLVPPGCGNAHFVLSDDCTFHYKLAFDGDYVDIDDQFVIKWNDKDWNFEWPHDNPILFGRDN